MTLIVQLQSEVRHRNVLELRYDFGQLYWDRSGRIARTVLDKFEGTELSSIDTNRCVLINRETNTNFTFGHGKLDISQSQNSEVEDIASDEEFSVTAETFADIVTRGLDLDSFPRLGFRQWLLYPTDEYHTAQELIAQLAVFQIDKQVVSKFGKVSECSFHMVVDRNSHRVRAAVAPFQQAIELPPSIIKNANIKARHQPAEQKQILLGKLKAKRKIENYPQFGVLMDFDIFIDDPLIPTDLTVTNFAREACKSIAEMKGTMLAKHENEDSRND